MSALHTNNNIGCEKREAHLNSWSMVIPEEEVTPGTETTFRTTGTVPADFRQYVYTGNMYVCIKYGRHI